MEPTSHSATTPSGSSCGHRVAIVGNTGSGKTTLAREIARRQGHFHLELDSIHHLPDWEPIQPELFMQRVREELEPRASWVTCGNYSEVGGWIRSHADTIVWLDLPRWRVACRVLRRSLVRGITREELWNGNRERLLHLFHPYPDKNVLLWSWVTHSRRHEQYEQESASGAWEHAEVIHLREPATVQEFVLSLGP